MAKIVTLNIGASREMLAEYVLKGKKGLVLSAYGSADLAGLERFRVHPGDFRRDVVTVRGVERQVVRNVERFPIRRNVHRDRLAERIDALDLFLRFKVHDRNVRGETVGDVRDLLVRVDHDPFRAVADRDRPFFIPRRDVDARDFPLRRERDKELGIVLPENRPSGRGGNLDLLHDGARLRVDLGDLGGVKFRHVEEFLILRNDGGMRAAVRFVTGIIGVFCLGDGTKNQPRQEDGIKNGFHGDAARTFICGGKTSKEGYRLVDVTKQAFFEGIKFAKKGYRIGDISHAIGEYVEKNGFSTVKEFQGHGIGREMHEDPAIPNYGKPGTGIILKEGMTFCVEPMVAEGRSDTRVLGDGWTVKMKDGKLSCHYENTIAVTSDGYEILTLDEGEK